MTTDSLNGEGGSVATESNAMDLSGKPRCGLCQDNGFWRREGLVVLCVCEEGTRLRDARAPRMRGRGKRPTVKVQSYYAGEYADGGDNYGVMIRLRGKWIEEVFEVGMRVQVTREERAGKLALVLEAV